MRIVFVSHNELGLACLEELIELDADVKHVFTKPNDANISDQVEFESFCHSHNIPITETKSVNDNLAITTMRKCDPDLLFVVGWSELVSSTVLNIPSVTAIGMHPSPLPRGRGRAPLAWSLIKGLDETALSFFHLVEKADAGDLVGQQLLSIDIDDDANSMYQKLIDAGRIMIREYYPKFEQGVIPRKPQEEEKATWWPRRRPQDGIIDWNRSPQEVYNWIRGQTRPYPGAFSYIDGKKVTIWDANPPNEDTVFVRPGEISYQNGDAIGVGVWESTIEITELQVENDKSVTGKQFLEYYGFQIGDQFQDHVDQSG
ncbi:methionyl-tRNA formyltransferase [Halorubrum sp. LN27]|uniref:methionyl-tRNA formyltransferase n=1 Tax=Halorubrum sp. LN27 TaxID=2801032 RepID=UPI0019095BDA|nr:methionyl-tRNA formyltransferase [Halorubrum sp. LN27]